MQVKIESFEAGMVAVSRGRNDMVNFLSDMTVDVLCKEKNDLTMRER